MDGLYFDTFPEEWYDAHPLADDDGPSEDPGPVGLHAAFRCWRCRCSDRRCKRCQEKFEQMRQCAASLPAGGNEGRGSPEVPVISNRPTEPSNRALSRRRGSLFEDHCRGCSCDNNRRSTYSSPQYIAIRHESRESDFRQSSRTITRSLRTEDRKPLEEMKVKHPTFLNGYPKFQHTRELWAQLYCHSSRYIQKLRTPLVSYTGQARAVYTKAYTLGLGHVRGISATPDPGPGIWSYTLEAWDWMKSAEGMATMLRLAAMLVAWKKDLPGGYVLGLAICFWPRGTFVLGRELLKSMMSYLHGIQVAGGEIYLEDYDDFEDEESSEDWEDYEDRDSEHECSRDEDDTENSEGDKSDEGSKGDEDPNNEEDAEHEEGSEDKKNPEGSEDYEDEADSGDKENPEDHRDSDGQESSEDEKHSDDEDPESEDPEDESSEDESSNDKDPEDEEDSEDRDSEDEDSKDDEDSEDDEATDHEEDSESAEDSEDAESSENDEDCEDEDGDSNGEDSVDEEDPEDEEDPGEDEKGSQAKDEFGDEDFALVEASGDEEDFEEMAGSEVDYGSTDEAVSEYEWIQGDVAC